STVRMSQQRGEVSASEPGLPRPRSFAISRPATCQRFGGWRESSVLLAAGALPALPADAAAGPGGRHAAARPRRGRRRTEPPPAPPTGGGGGGGAPPPGLPPRLVVRGFVPRGRGSHHPPRRPPPAAPLLPAPPVPARALGFHALRAGVSARDANAERGRHLA